MGGAPYRSVREGRGGVGALSNAAAFNHKRAPMSYVYSDSMPSKQIIEQTIVYNGATSGFKVKA